MTCIYDTVHQVGVHIRQAVLDTHGDSNDISSELNKGKLKLRYCEKATKFEIKKSPTCFDVTEWEIVFNVINTFGLYRLTNHGSMICQPGPKVLMTFFWPFQNT